jgi:recombination protein U
MGLGNRGMVFEILINLSNEMYQRGGFIMAKFVANCIIAN